VSASAPAELDGLFRLIKDIEQDRFSEEGDLEDLIA
jgi:hypothetical protein